jgi:hypothetical protein
MTSWREHDSMDMSTWSLFFCRSCLQPAVKNHGLGPSSLDPCAVAYGGRYVTKGKTLWQECGTCQGAGFEVLSLGSVIASSTDCAHAIWELSTKVCSESMIILVEPTIVEEVTDMALRQVFLGLSMHEVT